MSNNRWTRNQLKLAFHLYCQLPFGKLHRLNPEVIELAELIGRTVSAVAMKLVNFASLDPAITATGRAGLGNASSLDREIWDEFHADWEALATECSELRTAIAIEKGVPTNACLEENETIGLEDFTGRTRAAVVQQRIKQHFFRRAVLSSYRGRCCMSGLSDARLLVASHIVPWSKDKLNRLNPSNGLCLSAIHDKSFDAGLIALSDDLKIILATQIIRSEDSFVKQIFWPIEGRTIEVPERFIPSPEFVARHRNEVFVD